MQCNSIYSEIDIRALLRDKSIFGFCKAMYSLMQKNGYSVANVYSFFCIRRYMYLIVQSKSAKETKKNVFCRFQHISMFYKLAKI